MSWAMDLQFSFNIDYFLVEKNLNLMLPCLSFHQELPRIHDRPAGSRIVNTLHLSFLAWTGLTVFALYAIVNYLWFQLWVLTTSSFFVLLSFVGDGLQHLEIAYYFARKQHQKKCT